MLNWSLSFSICILMPFFMRFCFISLGLGELVTRLSHYVSMLNWSLSFSICILMPFFMRFCFISLGLGELVTRLSHYVSMLNWSLSFNVKLLFQSAMNSLNVSFSLLNRPQISVLTQHVKPCDTASKNFLPFKVQMKCFFYRQIWKSSKNQDERRLPFLNIASSSRVIKV